MPKSSRPSCTPSARSSRRTFPTTSECSRTTPSVISSLRRDGATPVSSRMRRTSCSRSGCVHWRAERLTLTTRCAGGRKLLVPASELAAGLVEHPCANRHDQAGVLGHRDELGREHESADRVIPAQQRFEPGEPGLRQGDDRLVVHLQLVPFERAAKILFQPQSFLRRGEHRRVEDLTSGLAQLLRPVHRRIRVPDHVLRAPVTVVTDDQPDADRRDHLPPLQLEWLRHGGTQPARRSPVRGRCRRCRPAGP